MIEREVIFFFFFGFTVFVDVKFVWEGLLNGESCLVGYKIGERRGKGMEFGGFELTGRESRFLNLGFGCWEGCRKESRGNCIENLCFSLFLVSLGLVECEVLSITLDDWKRGYFFFFFCLCEICVGMFVEWGMMFGWLENWRKERKRKEFWGFELTGRESSCF